MPPSKLAHLSLRILDVAPNVLSSILERITNLRSCELTTNTTSIKFNVVAVIDALLANTRNTLEKLTLHADILNSADDRSVSFAGFNTFVYLEITYDCLCLPSTDVTGVTGLPVALLASLQTLKIHTHQYREGLAPNILALLADTRPKQAKLECPSVKSWLEDKDKKSM